MAYLQITSRCNMRCAHCCFACTSKGTDMSMEVFHKALDLCSGMDEYFTIGGGEPTLHPNFKEILLEVIAKTSKNTRLFIVTNGSITPLAILIADLTESGVIDGKLSNDKFHSPIDPKVVKRFAKLHALWSTDNNNGPLRVGRATRLPKSQTYKVSCACEDTFFHPNGNIKQCGCIKSPIIGNVWEGIIKNVDRCCYREKW